MAAVAATDPLTHAYPAVHGPEHRGVVRPDTLPNRPAKHRPVHVAEVRPGVAPNSPAEQLEQTAAAPVLKVPGPHCTAVDDVEPAGHACPGVHGPVQAALTSRGTLPNRPGPQGPAQAAVGRACTSPYRPGGQSMQTLEAGGEYVPAGHTAAVVLVDPSAHAYPAVQLPAQAAVVRPGRSPKVPAGQRYATPPVQYLQAQ